MIGNHKYTFKIISEVQAKELKVLAMNGQLYELSLVDVPKKLTKPNTKKKK